MHDLCPIFCPFLILTAVLQTFADEPVSHRARSPLVSSFPADALTPENGVAKSVRDSTSEAPNSKGNKSAESTNAVLREGRGSDIIPLPSRNRDETSEAFELLRTARIHQKIGAFEYGNVHEYEKALSFLAMAASNAKSEDPQQVGENAALLKNEIENMRNAASKTFFGRFPLVRSFGLWTDDDKEFQVRSFLRKGEARHKAVFSVLSKVANGASTSPLNVLILVPGNTDQARVESPLAQAVDAQATEAFSQIANISVYPGALRSKVKPMPAWTSADPAFDPICRQLLKLVAPAKEPRGLMLVLVREFADEANDGYWVQAQQRTFEATTLEKADGKPESLEADKIKIFDAVAHDRSHFSGVTWMVVALLFIVASIANWAISASSIHGTGGWQRLVVIPISGFLIGAGLTSFVMATMERWMPEAHEDASVAVWWPLVAGSLSLMLPIGVFRLIAGSIGKYVAKCSCHGRWGVAFVSVALGTTASWIGPVFYSVGLSGISLTLEIAFATSLMAYCFGRAIDVVDDCPAWMAVIPILVSILFGFAAFSVSHLLLGVVVVLKIAATAGLFFYLRRTSKPLQASELVETAFEAEPINSVPRTIEQLRAAIESPGYHASRLFRRLEKSIAKTADLKAHWIGLSGPEAIGKSAAAQCLIAGIKRQHPTVLVLMARCAESAPAFQPFKDALARLGALAGIIATNPQTGDVNTFFDRLADEFIPFWNFFSSDSNDEDTPPMTRHDLFEGVNNIMERMTEQRPVLLWLDDVHNIDASSAALLRELQDRFPPGSDSALTVVLTSREYATFAALGGKIHTLHLAPPSAEEQVHFLCSEFGLDQTAANHLVKSLGIMSEQAGSFLWLLRALSQLVEEDALRPSSTGFKLNSQFKQKNHLPIPEVMRVKLRTSLQASNEHVTVLQCASLLGLKFRVDDVAETLGMDRLKLLQVLRHLDRDLKLVCDVVNDDECYAFSSEFMLQIVREELGGGFSSGESNANSKIAQELHARIARVLEKRQPRTSRLIYQIAKHYHAAGERYSEECVVFALAAAEAAYKLGEIQKARAFLQMARSNSASDRRRAEIVAIQVTLECDQGIAEHSAHLAPA